MHLNTTKPGEVIFSLFTLSVQNVVENAKKKILKVACLHIYFTHMRGKLVKLPWPAGHNMDYGMGLVTTGGCVQIVDSRYVDI